MKKHIFVTEETAKNINDILSKKGEKSNLPSGNIVFSHFVNFDDGKIITLEVLTSCNTSWVEIFLVNRENLDLKIQREDKFVGEHILEYGEKKYIVEVVIAD